jgi:hypothetical protein
MAATEEKKKGGGPNLAHVAKWGDLQKQFLVALFSGSHAAQLAAIGTMYGFCMDPSVNNAWVATLTDNVRSLMKMVDALHPKYYFYAVMVSAKEVAWASVEVDETKAHSASAVFDEMELGAPSAVVSNSATIQWKCVTCGTTLAPPGSGGRVGISRQTIVYAPSRIAGTRWMLARTLCATPLCSVISDVEFCARFKSKVQGGFAQIVHKANHPVLQRDIPAGTPEVSLSTK